MHMASTGMGPALSEEWDRVVEDDSVIVRVPETFCALDSQGVQALDRQVDPAEPSMYYGVDIYLNALHSCNNGGMSDFDDSEDVTGIE